MKRFHRFIFRAPILNGMVVALLGVMANVLAGIYVFQITKNDPVTGQWLDIRYSPHTISFWVLIAIFLLAGYFGWGMTTHAAKVQKEVDLSAESRQLLADMISQTVRNAMNEKSQNRLTDFEALQAKIAQEFPKTGKAGSREAHDVDHSTSAGPTT